MAVKKLTLAFCTLAFLQTGFAGFERFWPFWTKSNTTSQVDDNWSELSTDQQKQLLQRYQNLKDISTNQSSSLQNRMDWFTQLPEQEQQKMREVWQQMSTQQRQEMRSRMQKAKSLDERNTIRQEYMQKFQPASTEKLTN
ncbi:DUF3106 domain-containing protein [Acinetobacter sp.]|uniref:DUF3106 domain-containing protein n=1 Tax=Acinetobacter sp. TaxID=472 RepID=UPI0031DF0FBB